MTGLVVAAGTLTLLGGLLARRAGPVAERRAQRRWPYALGVPSLASLSMMFLGGVGLWASSLIAFTLPIGLATRRP